MAPQSTPTAFGIAPPGFVLRAAALAAYIDEIKDERPNEEREGNEKVGLNVELNHGVSPSLRFPLCNITTRVATVIRMRLV